MTRSMGCHRHHQSDSRLCHILDNRRSTTRPVTLCKIYYYATNDTHNRAIDSMYLSRGTAVVDAVEPPGQLKIMSVICSIIYLQPNSDECRDISCACG